MAEISNDELLKLVVATDDEALSTSTSPKQRMLPVAMAVMKKLGYSGSILAGTATPPIVERIFTAYRLLYRPSDLAIGGMHGGIFMFRDVFARVGIPFGYGKMSINPFELTDLSEMQLRWLCSQPSSQQIFMDQFIDIFDFAGGVGGLGDYKTPPKEALEVFWLAAFQLQAAAAALSVAFDSRGAVQSALVGAELVLKGGLAAIGASESERRKHGHDLVSVAKAYSAAYTDFDLDRVLATMKRLPAFVENRYSPVQPTRVETGHIVMGAQYIAGEVMRQITGFSFRSAVNPPATRVYPSN
jgi:hypothetical protein